MNLYGYVRNSPANFTDPQGQCWDPVSCGAAAAGLIGGAIAGALESCPGDPGLQILKNAAEDAGWGFAIGESGAFLLEFGGGTLADFAFEAAAGSALGGAAGGVAGGLAGGGGSLLGYLAQLLLDEDASGFISAPVIGAAGGFGEAALKQLLGGRPKCGCQKKGHPS